MCVCLWVWVWVRVRKVLPPRFMQSSPCALHLRAACCPARAAALFGRARSSVALLGGCGRQHARQHAHRHVRGEGDAVVRVNP